MRQSFPNRRSGFTLIELLVVLAIIVLLVSIVVPATQRALRRSRATACMANLRAIGQGLLLHSAENKGRLMTVTPHVRDGDQGNHNRWYVKLIEAGHLGDTRTFYYWDLERTPYLICPSIEPSLPRSHTGHLDTTTYVMNGWFGGVIGGARADLSLEMVDNPARTLWVGEGTYPGQGIFLHPVAENSGPWRSPADLHNGGCNLLFVDGHVGWALKEELTASASTRETPGAIWRFY